LDDGITGGVKDRLWEGEGLPRGWWNAFFGVGGSIPVDIDGVICNVMGFEYFYIIFNVVCHSGIYQYYITEL
jgi:hypothetical protein